MSTVYVVGLGPGAEEQMTVRAQKVLEHCPVLIGYNVYIDLVKEQFPDKIFLRRTICDGSLMSKYSPSASYSRNTSSAARVSPG